MIRLFLRFAGLLIRLISITYKSPWESIELEPIRKDVSGCAILSGGKLSMVLDARDLIHHAS